MKKSLPSCPENNNVLCPDKTQCDRCGWNPVVSSARLRRIKEDLGIHEQEETPIQTGNHGEMQEEGET